MWSTTSLRGLLMATVRVDVLTEAVHSGMASGIVPSSFRILRILLDRIEDSKTGKLHPACYAAVPPEDLTYAKKAGDAVGDGIWKKFPWAGKTEPVSKDPAELVLGGTWMPALSITGADGLPAIANAGNVLRSHTAVRLSLRTPPSVEPKDVAAVLEKVLTENVPYGAKVSFELEKAQKGQRDTEREGRKQEQHGVHCCFISLIPCLCVVLPSSSGWAAPKVAAWLGSALEHASQSFYGETAMYTGEGGSIPFMVRRPHRKCSCS